MYLVSDVNLPARRLLMTSSTSIFRRVLPAILALFLALVLVVVSAHAFIVSATETAANETGNGGEESVSKGQGTCQSPDIRKTAPLQDEAQALAELKSIKEEEIPAEYLESALGFENYAGGVSDLSDGTTMRFVSGYDEEKATTIVRIFDSAGNLISAKAIEAENDEGTINVVKQFQNPSLEASPCKQYNSECLKNAANQCPSGKCAFLFWNPVLTAGCLITSCGISVHSCCTQWIAPGDDLSNMHD